MRQIALKIRVRCCPCDSCCRWIRVDGDIRAHRGWKRLVHPSITMTSMLLRANGSEGLAKLIFVQDANGMFFSTAPPRTCKSTGPAGGEQVRH